MFLSEPTALASAGTMLDMARRFAFLSADAFSQFKSVDSSEQRR